MPNEIGSSDSNGESENAELTLDPDVEDLGVGLQDDEDEDIMFCDAPDSILFSPLWLLSPFSYPLSSDFDSNS